MKSVHLFALGIVLIVAIGFYIIGSSESSIDIDDTNYEGELQQVTLGVKDLNYYPREIRVKAGQPVELTLDSSVTGCLRSFTIPELKVVKYSKSPSETIKFTIPDKGTYNFACSMGMGYGKIIAE